MSLSDQIMADMKSAMKNHDKTTLNTVRMIKSALMNEKIKVGHDLTPDEELTVLNREKKQREESIDEFIKANRDDLAEETKKELAVVEKYMPKQMNQDELRAAVKETILMTVFDLVLVDQLPQSRHLYWQTQQSYAHQFYYYRLIHKHVLPV